MVLVGEADVGDAARGRTGVDEDCAVALNEAVPFKVEWDFLRSADHLAIHDLCALSLCVDDSHELAESMLNSLEDVCLELRKAILHADQILSVVVLFLDLLVEAVYDATLKNVWVVGRRHLA